MKKYFGTDGIRGRANTGNMTSEFALKLGIAIASLLKNNNGFKKHSIVIGKDTRRSGYMLESALTAGLTAGGINEVYLIGPIPTPGVAMLTKSMRCDLGIMISASHNEYSDNGIKLFDANGVKFPDDLELKIENIIDQDNLMEHLALDDKIGRAWRSDNYIYQQRYIEYVKSTFSKDVSLEGTKIILDCANGSNYKIAPTVLWELGARIFKIGCEPDGTNINDNCGSTKPTLLQKKVIEENADLGVAFDGDADRIIIVDENGNIIDGDKIIALLAKKMYDNNELKNNTVVVTQMSNLGLELYLNSLKIKVIRTQVGDRHVSECMRKNNYNLGGEQSGHIILGNYSSTGDGLCCALQVLEIFKKEQKKNKNITFSKLFDLYNNIPQKLYNIKYKDKNPLEEKEVKDIISNIENQLKNIGRVLVRKSGTEPLIRVMIECKYEDQLNKFMNGIVGTIEKFI